ncbi:MAG: histidine phosphatase family protein [Propionibacteriaceae bacterium]|jgi:alpha-ribazole phosphatase|nr:histidine phosphatase family protein [Propionibacteriaceae bacterium]
MAINSVSAVNVYLIRHPRPLVEPGVCYGLLDLDVGDESLNETAAHISAALPASIDHWFTSPLQRARKLADTLTGQAEVDKRLVEHNFGDWEGRRWAEIPVPEFDLWDADFVTKRPPMGESFDELHTRVGSFLEDLRERFAGEEPGNIAVVTHSGVIRSSLCRTLGMPLHKAFSLGIGWNSMAQLRLSANRQLDQVRQLTSTDW